MISVEFMQPGTADFGHVTKLSLQRFFMLSKTLLNFDVSMPEPSNH